MGMPLYGLNTKEYKEEKLKEDLTEEEVFYLNGLGGSRMSSMSSMTSMERLKGRRSSLAELRSGPRARSRSPVQVQDWQQGRAGEEQTEPRQPCTPLVVSGRLGSAIFIYFYHFIPFTLHLRQIYRAEMLGCYVL